MKYLMLCFVLLFSGACATSLSTNETSVIIDSVPSGQKFSVTNSEGKIVHKGTTPETVMLDTSAGYFVPAKHELSVNGKKTKLKAEMSAFYFANALNLIGFAIDPFTGCMWNLPDVVTVSNDEAKIYYSADTVK
jgi:hypothetical protein